MGMTRRENELVQEAERALKKMEEILQVAQQKADDPNDPEREEAASLVEEMKEDLRKRREHLDRLKKAWLH